MSIKVYKPHIYKKMKGVRILSATKSIKDNLKENNPHNLIMENRGVLNISGVKDIDSYDEKQIIIYTEQGELVIKGKNLSVESFDNETGNFKAKGKVNSLIYSQNRKNVGVFTKIFR